MVLGVDVEKMRRAHQRTCDTAAAAERRVWLASLTPEHRELHERALGGLCSECMAQALNEANAKVRAAAESIRWRP